MAAIIEDPPEPPTAAWYPLRPHAIQSALLYCPKRFVCVPAGRRSGKTQIALRKLVMSTPFNRGHNETNMYAFLAPTRPQAKRVAWNTLKKLVPEHWRLGLPYETDLIIRTIFNAEIHVIGMDRPERFEGSGWDGVVIDESADQKAGVFSKSIRPALADRLGWAWQIGVPKRNGTGTRHYRQFCELGFSGRDPDWASFTWPSWDILTAAEIEAVKRTTDAKDFNEQYGASWETIGGSAFHEFSRQSHVRPTTYDPTRPLLIASDFNVDPMAWTISQLVDDGLDTIDEIWLSNTNTKSTLKVLHDRYRGHKGGFEFYGDAASRQRKTSASSSDYAQIKNDKDFSGAVVRYPKKNPPVRDRLASCNALLRNAAGEVRWHIDPKCEQLIADLENRGLDEHGMPVEADRFGGHITDASGYLIHMKWPSTRITPKGIAQIGIYHG